MVSAYVPLGCRGRGQRGGAVAHGEGIARGFIRRGHRRPPESTAELTTPLTHITDPAPGSVLVPLVWATRESAQLASKSGLIKRQMA